MLSHTNIIAKTAFDFPIMVQCHLQFSLLVQRQQLPDLYMCGQLLQQAIISQAFCYGAWANSSRTPEAEKMRPVNRESTQTRDCPCRKLLDYNKTGPTGLR